MSPRYLRLHSFPASGGRSVQDAGEAQFGGWWVAAPRSGDADALVYPVASLSLCMFAFLHCGTHPPL
jgi:hypothetical protein